jgi:hypothetical protein
MPYDETDLPAYKFVYDSLSEVAAVGIMHNHQYRFLPPPVNTFAVFPLGKNDSYPCGLQDYVKPGGLFFAIYLSLICCILKLLTQFLYVFHFSSVAKRAKSRCFDGYCDYVQSAV